MAGLLVLSALGCERKSSSDDASDQTLPSEKKDERPLPQLVFPHDLRAAYPKVSAFLDEFLGTCLVGDYTGYRRLVSRAFEPETRERFEAIYQAIESVTVESIEPINLPRVPPPAYRVVSTVELSRERGVKLRETHRKVAILVFREQDRWRMAPAPAALQPRDEPPPATTSAPTTTAPSYPWDEDGDY